MWRATCICLYRGPIGNGDLGVAVSTQKTLVGWKAIAAYLSRDERTAMRWALHRGMPVKRIAGQARSSVYAWPDDLDAWLGRPDALTPTADTAGAADTVEAADTTGAADPDALADAQMPTAIAAAQRRWQPWPVRRVVIAAGLLVAAAAVAAWMGLVVTDRAEIATVQPGAAVAMFRDAQARTSYLQARFDWNLRTHDSLLRALGEFGDAVVHDPGAGAPYVGIADTYLMLPEYAAMPRSEAYSRAEAAARIAITLDPHAMEAQRALGFIAFWWHGDVKAAAGHFAAALALAPNDSLTHDWLARALAANGEQAAAFREITTARALDPASRATTIDYGLIALLAGHREDSTAVLHALRTADIQDAVFHRILGDIALAQGRDAEYLAEAKRAAHLRNDPLDEADIARQTQDFANGGAPLMFEHMVDAARDRTLRTDAGFFALARVAAIAGRSVAAIDALAPACTQAEPDAIGAPGDLWLAHAISAATIHGLCNRPALDSAVFAGRRKV